MGKTVIYARDSARAAWKFIDSIPDSDPRAEIRISVAQHACVTKFAAEGRNPPEFKIEKIADEAAPGGTKLSDSSGKAEKTKPG